MGAVERVSFLRQHMARAKAVGIEAVQELALYCGLALLHGEDFSGTSPWRELLTKVSTGLGGLTDAVAVQEA